MGTENGEEVTEEKREQDIVNMILFGSSAARPEAGSVVEILRSAMTKSRFVQDTFFNNLEDEFGRENDFFSLEKEMPGLTGPP